uniref:Uncharacterized protein n=1 Tax=Avena sativa TaxID=4498 RepID=A0ACD5YY10_AVESA
MEEEEEGDEFLKVLRALRDAARAVESGSGGPALHALLALDASKDHLLAGDPELRALCRVLARVRALSWSLELSVGEPEGGGLVGELRARCRRCKTRRGIARAAGEVAREIQAWMDRELAKRLVAALRREGDVDARASALLGELEARLMGLAESGRFDARLQDAVLRHGVFAAVEARLGVGDPSPVSDGCAAVVLALVRFNRDVFVGPVLMGPAVGALVSAAASSPAPLRALNGLVDAIRTPLVDELHGRGELPRLVALLFGDPRVRALALELVLRVAYYGRGEVLDALLAEGLVKRLLCLQRTSGLGGGEFVSAVARFAVQVEVGQGLGPREKRLAKLDILRRVREAAVSPAEEATVVAEVLWGATP